MAITPKHMIKQGEIFWADLNPVIGHEQSGFRPVLILQNNLLNENLNTVIIAPITKNLQAKGFLTTLLLSTKESGLTAESLALLFQLRTIDKKRLKTKIGAIKKSNLQEIRRRLSWNF